MAKARSRRAEPRVILGILRDKKSADGLAGYTLTAFGSGGRRVTLGQTVSNIDGAFRLVLDTPRGSRADSFGLRITNRMGAEVHLQLRAQAGTACDPLIIDIDARPELDIPPGPTTVDAFKVLRNVYPSELSRLASAGIRDQATLLAADADVLALQTRLPLARIEAMRLHAELAHADGFTQPVAAALLRAGFRTREQLATASPPALVRALQTPEARRALAGQRMPTNSVVYGWVGYAKGYDPTPFATAMNTRQVLRDGKLVTDRVKFLNPSARILAVAGLMNPFARLQTMARVRAIMEAAGVYDLSSLGTFYVRGPRVLRPGYYVARRSFDIAATKISDQSLMLKLGAGFAKVKAAVALDDAIHYIPNPVTDAVILGSLVSFIEDGKLIIGKEVTSLIIVTEEILYSQLNEIRYEDKDRVPLPRASMVPDRAAMGTPVNDRNVYSPGAGDRGRNGGTGSPGATGQAGIDGDAIGRAPTVEIYVQRTPQGLPKVVLKGRRGGTGQPGQHGGHGSDGARGREASSGVCQCSREVGQGGDGGMGGPGGNGGVGGAGGTGGSLTIGTLAENIAPLTTLRPLFVELSGGGGGNGGDAGIGGEGGKGGAPGDDSGPWCEQEPSRVGTDGVRGPNGMRGADGPEGGSGGFTLQPLTLSDWNALFNRPWLIRLEPWEGTSPQTVRVVARNITTDTVLLLDGTVVTPTNLNVIAGTFDFVLPVSAAGGQRSVQLRLMGANGYLYSNTVTFRVLPQLTGLAPTGGVPGTTITLTGSGFSAGAQVRVDSLTLNATVVSGSQLRVTLPDHEGLAPMPAGPKSVSVVNPDGRATGSLSFALTLDINVRVKAWLVFPDVWVGGGGGFGGPGPARDAEDVRDIFIESHDATEVWAGHRIVLQFDPNVGIASLPADVAESWPIDDATLSTDSDLLKATAADGTFLHFVDGAVNFYFVSDIDDWSTHAYTYRGSEVRRQEFVIYEDTGWLTDWEEAHVAAHELGHVLGLPHVCDDEDEAQTTFGRSCNEETDKDFLMFPSTNFHTDEGNTVTVEEARKARRVAQLWHGL